MKSSTVARLLAAAVILAVAAVIGWRGLGTAADADAPPAELVKKLEGKHWYRVSVLGKASGWAFFDNWTRQAPDGSLQLVSRQRIEFAILLNNRRITASQEVTVRTDSQLRPVKITMAADEAGRPKNVKAVVVGDELRVESWSGGRHFSKTIALPDDWGSDMVLALKAASGQLQPGDTATVSVFDPDLLDTDRHHVRVVGWEEKEAGGQRRRLLRLEDQTERLKLTIITYIDSDGVMWRQEVPKIMNLVLEKVSEEEAKAFGEPLSLTNRVELDKPLPNSRSVKTLVLTARLKHPVEQPFPSTSRQQVDKQDERTFKLTLTTSKSPRKVASWPATIPDELKGLTAATTIVQSDDEAIRKKAREITEGSKNAWEAARRIVQWVYANMKKVASEPRPVSALECLESMVGDCTEHAVLAGALARAVGLPTKMCVGLGYTGDAFYYHAWTKVWVGEWVEMDPTWGEDLADPTHIQVAEGAFDEMSLARMSLATARIIGQLELQLVDTQFSEP